MTIVPNGCIAIFIYHISNIDDNYIIHSSIQIVIDNINVTMTAMIQYNIYII